MPRNAALWLCCSFVLLCWSAQATRSADAGPDFTRVGTRKFPDAPTVFVEDGQHRIYCAVRGTNGLVALLDGDRWQVRSRGNIGGITRLSDGLIRYTAGKNVIAVPTDPLADRSSGTVAPGSGIFANRLDTLWIEGNARLYPRFAPSCAAPAPPPGLICQPRACDQFGNLWALTRKAGTTTWTGVAMLPDAAPERWQPIEIGKNAGALADLVSDTVGYIWIAGKAGVLRFDPRQPQEGWTTFPRDGALPAGEATALGLSPAGMPVVGLASGALYELDIQPRGKYLVNLITSAALPRAPVRGIFTDAQGRLWVSAGGGIYRRDASAQAWQRHWNTLAALPRNDHDVFAAVVGDKAYLPGGMAAHGFPAVFTNFDRMSVYDAAANRWTLTPPMSVSRCYTGVAALQGRIWVIGGGIDIDGKRRPTDLVEIYDPATGAWAKGPALDKPRTEAVVTAAAGRIYVIGGTSPAGYETSAVSIGPGETTWRPEPPSPLPLFQCAGCTLNDIIYIMVGHNPGLLAYDPARRAWRNDLAPIPLKDGGPRSSQVIGHQGEVWMLGGRETDQPLAAWHYNPATNTWQAGPDLPHETCWGAAADINGRLLLMGGAYYDAPHAVYIFWDTAFEMKQ